MQSLFGLQLSQPLVYLAAIAIILLLLAICAWVLRKVSWNGTQSESGVRGRQPRLGIVDTFQLDRQRQLVIIRRDSVEHLLLLGGTSDIVVESSIVRSMASQTQPRDSATVARVAAPPPATLPAKAPGSVSTNAPTELSFATELTAPYPSAPLLNQDVAPHIAAPKPSDLSEIANRFQTANVKPISAEREVSMPSVSSIPFGPRPTQGRPTNELDLPAPALPDGEPIIPAVERNLPPIEPSENAPTVASQTIQSRDVGSLNDTLRQLLGRTREN